MTTKTGTSSSHRVRNFYALVAAAAASHASRPAVAVQRRDRVDAWTYRDLMALADDASRWLLARGIGAGDRCAIMADNDAHWCAAYLGTLRIGAVAVPLDTSYKAKQIGVVLVDAGARVIWTSPKYLDRAKEAVAGLAATCAVAMLHGAGSEEIFRSLPCPACPDLPPPGAIADGRTDGPLPECPAVESDAAVILYTSGTTSDPKGVVLTHANVLAEREAAFAVVHIDEQDTILGVLPLFHALAQMANLLLPFSIGARVVFLESLGTSELMRALAEREVTAFCCVPQFFYLLHQRVMQEVASARLLKRLVFRTLLAANGWLRAVLGVNIGPTVFARVHHALGRRMRILITGGSRLDPAVGRDLYRLGFNLMQAYGLTETSGAATITRPGDHHLTSVGPALPGCEIQILPRDSGDEEVTDGEVAIRGPIVMRGYFNRPDATTEAIHGEWLRTGDLGYLDNRGRLYITGRKKEIIVLSSGKNIYPEEVEAHYLHSPFIKELCVVGLSRPDEPAAERLHALVRPDQDVMREKKIVNTRELIRFELEGLSVQLPSHKRILGYDITFEPLPRTTTGKLKRFAILRQLTAQAGRDSEAVGADTSADAAWLADPHVAEALDLVRAGAKPGALVRADANLELDLGLDSMERVETLTTLEQHFGVRVAEGVAQTIFTVRELVEAVRPGTAAAGGPRERAQTWSHLLAQEPEADPYLAELQKSKVASAVFFFAIAKITYVAFRLLLRFEVKGREHVPQRGAFLLSPNHQSYLDPFFLVIALPFRTIRRLFFVGAAEYFETPFSRWVARLWNVVPVDPDSNLVRAMQAGAYGLRRGRVLIVFPEGERSIDGTVRAFKKGAAILSAHLQVPIIPVAIDGVYEMWPRKRPFQWRTLLPWSRHRVILRFGPPLEPPPVSAPGQGQADAPPGRVEEQYVAGTARLRDAVVAMWNEEHQRRPTREAASG